MLISMPTKLYVEIYTIFMIYLSFNPSVCHMFMYLKSPLAFGFLLKFAVSIFYEM